MLTIPVVPSVMIKSLITNCPTMERNAADQRPCRPPSAGSLKYRRHLRADEVPDHFRELYIETAYRNPNSSFRECLRSVFEATNETFNFWTHLLPSFYFVWYIYTTFTTEINLFDDVQHTLPFLVYSVSVCVFPVASALAHVFNTMSDHARHVCFFVDYAGLSFFALGSAVAYKAYSFPSALRGTLFASLYFPAASVIAILSMTLCSATRLMPNNILKKVVRMSSMAFPYLFDVLPVVYRYLLGDAEDLTSAIYLHMRQFIFTFFSAFFYISHLPERAFPGYFDVFGHSHQIFHTMSILGARDQLHAFLLDVKESRPAGPPPHHSDAVLPFHILCVLVMVLVSIINVTQLVLFSSQIHRIIPQGPTAERSWPKVNSPNTAPTDHMTFSQGAHQWTKSNNEQGLKKRSKFSLENTE